ncbi:hypothetical protein [Jidongwangia harbinensis]|uniref:hypothetical protein n=1 Tax=Jidongwangia harbinensis TaxID=2878561 RepID=UPI001CD9CE65|nr:hypothetical protein [Jidongwangia harbinensis]MCA2219317.1 hypothetical protein [Jidongwangia harbinensis]
MTNWMTAAGIALIAGGLATLIGFRHALWGGKGNRRRNRPQRAIEPTRRAVPPAAPVRPHRTEVPQPRGARRRRSGAPVAGDAAVQSGVRGHREQGGGHREPDGGLASLGLADEEPVPGPAGDETSADPLPGVGPAGAQRTGRRSTVAGPSNLEPSGAGEDRLRSGAGEDRARSVAGGTGARNRPDVLRAQMPEPVGRIDAPAERSDEDQRSGRILPSVRPAAPTLGGRAERSALGADREPSAPGVRGTPSALGGDREPGLGVRAGAPGARTSSETPAGPVDDDEPGMSTAVMVTPPLAPGSAAPSRRIDRTGDRVDGWVRPEYQDEQPVSGEYWTPVPERIHADGGYGWPVPVERLPAVPPQPPASGFDAVPADEPTALVPPWPPATPSERFESPRSWPVTNDATAGRHVPDQVRKAGAEPNPVDRAKVARWAERDRDSAPPAWPARPAGAHPRSLWPLRSDPDPVARGASGRDPVVGGASGRDPVARGASGRDPVVGGASGRDPVARGASGRDPVVGGASGPDSVARGASGPDPVARGASGPDPVARAADDPDPVARVAFGQDPMARVAFGPEVRPGNDRDRTGGGTPADTDPVAAEVPVEAAQNPFVRTTIRPDARLRRASDPATGTDRRPAEPVIPDWTPTPPGGGADRERDAEPVFGQPGWNRSGPPRTRVSPVTEFIPVAESTPMVPSLDAMTGETDETDEAERPRRRPRPRPRPQSPENRSTVYVSKHAAEPG